MASDTAIIIKTNFNIGNNDKQSTLNEVCLYYAHPEAPFHRLHVLTLIMWTTYLAGRPKIILVHLPSSRLLPFFLGTSSENIHILARGRGYQG